MRNWILILCFLFSANLGFAQEATKTRLHLVYIGSEKDPQYKWFESNAELSRMKTSPAAIQWTFLKPEDSIFKERYAPIVGDRFPIVLLETEEGRTIYAASADTMPATPSELFVSMKTNYGLSQEAKPINRQIDSPRELFQFRDPVQSQLSDSIPIANPCTGPNCRPLLPSLTPQSEPPWRPDSGGGAFFEGPVQRVSNLVWLTFALSAMAFAAVVILAGVWLGSKILGRQQS